MVMDIFSFVDVIFVLDPPLGVDGCVIPHEDGCGKDLFSFVVGSGVQVFVRSTLVGLFDVCEHSVDGVSIGFVCDGVRIVMRGVYLRPGRTRRDWDDFAGKLAMCDVVFGDFNARHRRWDPSLDYDQSHGNWLVEWADRFGSRVEVPDGPSFRGISCIDLVVCKKHVRSQRSDRVGLEHHGILIRFRVDDLHDMMKPRPAWKRVDKDV